TGYRVRRQGQSQNGLPLRVGAKSGGADLGVIRHVPELIVLVGRRRRQIENVNDPLLRFRVPDDLGVGPRNLIAGHRNDPRRGGDDIVYLLLPLVLFAGELGVLSEKVGGGEGEHRGSGDQQPTLGLRFDPSRRHEWQDLLHRLLGDPLIAVYNCVFLDRVLNRNIPESVALYNGGFPNRNLNRSRLFFSGNAAEQTLFKISWRGLDR